MKKYAFIIFLCSVGFVAFSLLNSYAEMHGSVEMQVFTLIGLLGCTIIGIGLFITKFVKK